MDYRGKIYGKIGPNEYFDTGKTSDDWDKLEAERKWISVEDRLPICYKAGDWDGKMSDLCICQDENLEYHLANCYDYGDTNAWYDKNDFGLWVKIVKWKQIIDD